MSLRPIFNGIAMLAAFSLYSQAATAVPDNDNDNDNDFSPIDICDVTLGGSCADAVDSSQENTNPNGATIIGGFGGLFGGDPWTELLKTDGGSAGSYNEVDFTITGFVPGTSAGGGDFSLNWAADPANLLPMAIDLVFAVKAASGFAAYMFDDEVIDDQGDGEGSSAGTWKITFFNSGDELPNLSHLSLFIRDGDPGPNTDPNPAPVPGTLLLLGLGLFGLRFARKSAV